eukprot:g5157.t1
MGLTDRRLRQRAKEPLDTATPAADVAAPAESGDSASANDARTSGEEARRDPLARWRSGKAQQDALHAARLKPDVDSSPGKADGRPAAAPAVAAAARTGVDRAAHTGRSESARLAGHVRPLSLSLCALACAWLSCAPGSSGGGDGGGALRLPPLPPAAELAALRRAAAAGGGETQLLARPYLSMVGAGLEWDAVQEKMDRERVPPAARQLVQREWAAAQPSGGARDAGAGADPEAAAAVAAAAATAHPPRPSAGMLAAPPILLLVAGHRLLLHASLGACLGEPLRRSAYRAFVPEAPPPSGMLGMLSRVGPLGAATSAWAAVQGIAVDFALFVCVLVLAIALMVVAS